MSQHDQEFLQQVRQTLEQGQEELDGDTRNRLCQARVAATAARERRHAHRGWILAGGAVASVVIALLVSLQMTQRPSNESMLEDLALLSNPADLEIYRDVDFYDWLAEREQTGGV
jgi:hypothetical protein